MLTFDRNDICLAPRALKTFEFPVSNVPIPLRTEKPDFILKPSMYRKVKKIKKIGPGFKTKSKSKSNQSQLKKKAHLTYLTNLALKPRKSKTLTLHLAGVSSHNSNTSNTTRLQLDDIDLETIITIKSGLKASDTVQSLKKLVRSTFNIPSSRELLIFYSHIVLSLNNESQLDEFGVTNKSLLLIAISARDHHSHQKHAKHRFNEQKIDCKNKVSRPSIDRMDIKCTKGFDVITQEANVDVYRMPICGHVMSKESLCHYALTHFEDKSNLHLTCPHTADMKEDEEEKYAQDNHWTCALCTFVNEENDTECAVCHNPKPWSCIRCTFINYTQRNKCEMCEADAPPLPHDIATEKKDNLCRELWDYSFIKSVLIKKDKSSKSKTQLEPDEKQKAIDEYYQLRHEYSSLKQKYEDIPLEFQRHIRQVQKQLINEFHMIDKSEVNKIRKKAKRDAALNRFRYPNANKLDRERMWKETAKLELLSARNNIQNKYRLQTCPKCSTIFYKPKKPKHNKRKIKSIHRHKMARYKTRCAVCDSQSFCFCCGKAWKTGHLCDSQFRLQLIYILKKAETKTIGEVKNVPNIRCCPKCCQLITHTEACKHMECRQCKTKFCFVCMKLYKNGSWQCGSSGARCPIAPRQNMNTLPNIIAINEESFQLF